MKRKIKDLSVRGQIQTGNTKIIWIIICIVVLSFINLGLIDLYQNRLNYYTEQVKEAKDIAISQYEWIDTLNDAIHTRQDADLEKDPSKCSFGQWYAGVKTPKDGTLAGYLQSAADAHTKLHNDGMKTLELAQLEPEAADLMLYQEVEADGDVLLKSLESYAAYYQEKADKMHDNLVSRVIWAIITNLVLAFAAAPLARRLGNKLAKKISEPIAAVADWSEELSEGAADLSFDISEHTQTDIEEVSRMIDSFRKMAASIQENVNVVKKVADGDMTAFVNIRSASDSLGKNLYRMVQSNDLMFAEISEIAGSVAEGAGNIAVASGNLAESCGVQARAVQEFSSAIMETGEFIDANNKKTVEAGHVTDEIRQEIADSTRKMEELLTAMENIREASEKVSAIIGTINDIAGQTNLLALNAAIEAARAGEAGRGFAVVADEVKDLAVKSSEAADESRKLIEDTIEKTAQGDRLSKATSETFAMIADSIHKITAITQEIADAGIVQQGHIGVVKENIAEISAAIEGNASTSRDAAAASAELNRNADELKESMRKFNLRKRTPGKPYIPPEKQNDPEFIRTAEENYRKALEEGKIHT